ncbi:XRE family transcriptional regulator [Bacteroides uniformis]|jgi:transcriptional regulator with XRE-family HTH domain|uniref:helix-turn-helix domain-containing protein n=1 Tax=Bacteroides uniformis TaxID=820 RepID=UPI000E436CA5|nr:helix-turn-helix transcriptional regulator [Bacteroides uniformis]RGN32501.1 XRE family transcriptional regulator [Bacteroides uniformis]RGN43737.1 XRE family transcriptional regulator [Bacteroides uniformis]
MADFKAFRKDNKLSQIKAAEYFGCNQSFISQIERGNRPIPEAFIEKAKGDISINATNLIDNISNISNIKEGQNETIPAYFLKMIFEERKIHDQKELELISQNQELINIIKNELAALKKGNALEEGNVICADASGSDLEK